MIKGVFFMQPLTMAKASEVAQLGVTTLFVSPENLAPKLGTQLQQMGFEVYLVKDLFHGAHLWERFPDCRPVGRDGKLFEVAADWYHGVCPTHSAVQALRLAELDALLDLEFVSGINLNFLRFPGYWEAARSRATLMDGCICARCLALHGGEGEACAQDQWKAGAITAFMQRVAALRDGKARRVPLGMHMVPWEDSRFERARPGALGQDIRRLQPFLDHLSPMCHFGLQDQGPTWVGEVVRWTQQASDKAVLPIVQAMDVTARNFADALSMAVQQPSAGAVVFAWELMQGSGAKCSALRAAFSG